MMDMLRLYGNDALTSDRSSVNSSAIGRERASIRRTRWGLRGCAARSAPFAQMHVHARSVHTATPCLPARLRGCRQTGADLAPSAVPAKPPRDTPREETCNLAYCPVSARAVG